MQLTIQQEHRIRSGNGLDCCIDKSSNVAPMLVANVVLYCIPFRDTIQYNTQHCTYNNTNLTRSKHVCYNDIGGRRMAYVDFPEGLKGQKERKKFWLSEPGLQLIAGWRRNGTPMTKIAEEYIGISKTAWWGWYKQSEDLRKAVAVSKDVANMTVEEALYKKAIGYDYWEEVWELVEGQVILTRKYKRHVPPDTKAILHWLFNRLPTQWRAVQEPLGQTKYTETVKNILVAMKQVADSGEDKRLEIKEDQQDE